MRKKKQLDVAATPAHGGGVAAAGETSVDAAAAVVSSEPGSIFAFEEKQRTAANAFLCGNSVAQLKSGFGKNLGRPTSRAVADWLSRQHKI